MKVTFAYVITILMLTSGLILWSSISTMTSSMLLHSYLTSIGIKCEYLCNKHGVAMQITHKLDLPASMHNYII